MKNKLPLLAMSRVLLLLCIGFLLSCAKNSRGRGDDGKNDSPGGLWVLGYYVAYDPVRDLCKPEEIDWTGLTHIVFGSIRTNANGSPAFDFYWDAVKGPALARDLSARAHAAGKKAILMLGGAGEGAAIHRAMVSHRTDFVKNLIQAMSDFGYDGLDLDWEEDVDWDLFLNLATDLRQALPHAILTMPVSPINPNFQSVEPRIARIAESLDRVNLMSYFPATAMAGGGWLSWHNSPLKGWKSNTPITIEDSLNRYAAAGIPRAKLGMGISFYAIGYTGGITGPNQSTETGVTIIGGDNSFPLSKLYGTGGAFSAQYRNWDSQALVPYLSLPGPDPEFGCRYISFEDEQSISEKGKFSRENGYGGIVVWNINQGYVRSRTNPNFLMQALKKAFTQVLQLLSA